MSFTGPVDIDWLFKVADRDGDGVVGVQDALAFFGGSFVGPAVMNSIWAITVTSRGAAAISRGDPFRVALLLVSAAQQGRPPILESLASPLPPPSFMVVSASDRAKFDLLFDQSVDPATGGVTGAKARELFSMWGVPIPVLGRIWEMSDVNRDGVLSREEFAVAMALTTHASLGRELPPAVPPTLFAKQPPTPPPQQQPPQSVPAVAASPPSSTPASTMWTNLPDLTAAVVPAATSPASMWTPLPDVSSQGPAVSPVSLVSSAPATSSPLSTPTAPAVPSRVAGIAREALILADTQARNQDRLRESEKLKTELDGGRAATAAAEAELKEEQAKGVAIGEQISTLASEIEAEKVKTADVKAKLIKARDRSAELVLEKVHKEQELAQAKKATAADRTALSEVEEQLRKTEGEIAKVKEEIAGLEAEQAATKKRNDETKAKLAQAIDSVGAVAVSLSKKLSELQEERQREEKLAAAVAAGPSAGSWPPAFVFGPKFAIPEGEVDPKLKPFDFSDDSNGALPANMWTYEPLR